MSGLTEAGARLLYEDLDGHPDRRRVVHAVEAAAVKRALRSLRERVAVPGSLVSRRHFLRLIDDALMDVEGQR